MNKYMLSIFLLVFAFGPVAAQDSCDRPWPVQVPESAETRDEVLAVQKQVKKYLADAEAYLACSEQAQARLPEDDIDTPKRRQMMVNQYNATVDEMHTVGERFNILVRAFKAKAADGDG